MLNRKVSCHSRSSMFVFVSAGRLPRRRLRRQGRCVITKRPAATRTTAGARAPPTAGATRRAHLCTKPQPSPPLKHCLHSSPFFDRQALSAAVGHPLFPSLIPSPSEHNPRAFPCALCKFHGSESRSFVARAHSLAQKRRNTLPESVALTTDRWTGLPLTG